VSIMGIDAWISVQSLLWLFLAVFMVHDLEEIIFVERSMTKLYPIALKKAPSFAAPLLKQMAGATSSKFAIAVLLEFIVFIPITYFAVERESYALFVGVNALMLAHVLTHAGQSIFLRAYTPGIATCPIIVLYTIYLFYRMVAEGLVTMGQIYLYAPLGLFVIPLVLLGHKLSDVIIRS